MPRVGALTWGLGSVQKPHGCQNHSHLSGHFFHPEPGCHPGPRMDATKVQLKLGSVLMKIYGVLRKKSIPLNTFVRSRKQKNREIRKTKTKWNVKKYNKTDKLLTRWKGEKKKQHKGYNRNEKGDTTTSQTEIRRAISSIRRTKASSAGQQLHNQETEAGGLWVWD